MGPPKSRPLQDRVVLITGASSGLGEAAARACARDGARLALAARREERLRQLVEAFERDGIEAVALQTDMRDPEAIRAMAVATLERFGQIDALVASAGIGHTSLASEISEELLKEQIEVNLLGVIRCARAVLPAMQAARRGQIIAVASVAAGCVMPGSAIYGATKAGVLAFCEGLRREVGRHGIAVTAVLPGFIATPMTEGHPFPMPPASLVGNAIARLIRRPRRRVVIPGWYAPLMTINRVAPALFDAIARHSPAP